MEKLLDKLKASHPTVSFEESELFCWSPAESKVMYSSKSLDQAACWSLLHELSHALLDHQGYDSDLELLLMEVNAWQKAKDLGKTYGIRINDSHIEDCLDTYRDWLHQRSKCPVCSNNGLQQDPEEYLCFNCQASWRVSNSRFSRPYRQLNRTKSKTSPEHEVRAMFI